MPRNVDCECSIGPHQFERLCEVDELVICPEHGNACQQLWWQPARKRDNTVWDKSEWAYVDRKADGSYSFPMRPDLKPAPEGYERLTIKSDADMARVEREAKVRSERRWFDRGSGHGFDSDKALPPIPQRMR